MGDDIKILDSAPVVDELHQKAVDKFTFKKINGLYFIIDTATGKKCSANGKVLRSKGVKKLARTLFLLREGYKQQLKQKEA